jgi:hypothetical protein
MQNIVIVEHCLTALSGVAASARSYIAKFYTGLVPSLKVYLFSLFSLLFLLFFFFDGIFIGIT